MLYDRGLATEKDKQDVENNLNFKVKGGAGCIGSRICVNCNHLISDSICLCIGHFICPNCGFENGKETKELIKNLSSLGTPIMRNKILVDNAEEVDSIIDAREEGWNACKKEVLEILKKHTIEHNGPHGTGFDYISFDALEEIEKL